MDKSIRAAPLRRVGSTHLGRGRSPVRRPGSPVVEAAGSPGERVGGDRTAATVGTAGQLEQDLAPAVQAPERLALVVIGTLADVGLHWTTANKASDTRCIADTRNDAHSSLFNEGPRGLEPGTAEDRQLSASGSSPVQRDPSDHHRNADDRPYG